MSILGNSKTRKGFLLSTYKLLGFFKSEKWWWSQAFWGLWRSKFQSSESCQNCLNSPAQMFWEIKRVFSDQFCTACSAYPNELLESPWKAVWHFLPFNSWTEISENHRKTTSSFTKPCPEGFSPPTKIIMQCIELLSDIRLIQGLFCLDLYRDAETLNYPIDHSNPWMRHKGEHL